VEYILRSAVSLASRDRRTQEASGERAAPDRLKNLQAKMREWMDNGAKLGWLIDPETRTVYIYRPGQTTERLVDPRRVEGEPPVDGFVLEMADIWNPDL
jgi:Uma2 family endonuclease